MNENPYASPEETPVLFQKKVKKEEPPRSLLQLFFFVVNSIFGTMITIVCFLGVPFNWGLRDWIPFALGMLFLCSESFAFFGRVRSIEFLLGLLMWLVSIFTLLIMLAQVVEAAKAASSGGGQTHSEDTFQYYLSVSLVILFSIYCGCCGYYRYRGFYDE